MGARETAKQLKLLDIFAEDWGLVPRKWREKNLNTFKNALNALKSVVLSSFIKWKFCLYWQLELCMLLWQDGPRGDLSHGWRAVRREGWHLVARHYLHRAGWVRSCFHGSLQIGPHHAHQLTRPALTWWLTAVGWLGSVTLLETLSTLWYTTEKCFFSAVSPCYWLN